MKKTYREEKKIAGARLMLLKLADHSKLSGVTKACNSKSLDTGAA